MIRLRYFLFLVVISSATVSGQERYSVEKAYFSTDRYDEFSPALKSDRIVFCSNREDKLFIPFKGKSNKGLFNIFTVSLSDSTVKSVPEVFSLNLITPYNDGPVTFDTSGTLIAYSRNVDIKTQTKNFFDPDNNLGIYFAELKEGEWINVKPFLYNDSLFSNTTPWFSPDGRYLYFASDRPGGYGGSDIYRSELTDGSWSKPSNLGGRINTGGNEVYPFVNANGDLFFASDGHPGFGKKDLFLSREINNEWSEPLHLDPPINTKADDFGLITDEAFSSGYFSSNRGRSDDIFSFKTVVPQLFNCDTLQENPRCYKFWDDQYPGIDSLPVVYEWAFSDGTVLKGLEVDHCFPGPGHYWAKLSIVDNSTSNTFFTQTTMEFDFTDIEQPYITSKDASIAKEDLLFSGTESNLPGFNVKQYTWDFGDNGFDTGNEVAHSYLKQGIYYVKLGLSGFPDRSDKLTTYCVLKPVNILADNQALAMYLNRTKDMIPDDLRPTIEETGEQVSSFLDSKADSDSEVYRIEVLSSPEKLSLNDTIFNQLRNDYQVKEYYRGADSLFSYTVGEYTSLLESYPVYTDVVEKGFGSATVKTYVIAELPVAVIEKINKDFAKMTDANFEFNQFKVSENSYSILDQVVEIMQKNPEVSLEIAAHTDNMGSFEYNMNLSQRRAQSIVDYMVSKGIEKQRLVGKGYGESRPIATNNSEEGRMKNRRVEFLILNIIN